MNKGINTFKNRNKERFSKVLAEALFQGAKNPRILGNIGTKFLFRENPQNFRDPKTIRYSESTDADQH